MGASNQDVVRCMESRLTDVQLYELNDVLTYTLASMGWDVRDEGDAEKLNDAVLWVAHAFFPIRRVQS